MKIFLHAGYLFLVFVFGYYVFGAIALSLEAPSTLATLFGILMGTLLAYLYHVNDW